MHRIIMLVSVGILCVTISACSGQESDLSESLPVQTTTKQNSETTTTEIVTTQEPTTAQNDLGNELFGKLTEKFVFSSGAGGWSTQIEINSDGTFHGIYQDYDAFGGDGYKATMSYSEFNGTFVDVKKVNNYTFSMCVSEFKYVNKPDTEEIKDNIKYEYVKATGMDDADTIYIYTPDALLLDLPKEYKLWIMKTNHGEDEKLGFYGLYNVSEKAGFSSTNK